MDCCDTPGLHGLKIEVDVAEELNDGHPSKLKNKGESCLILIQKQLYFNDFCFVVVVVLFFVLYKRQFIIVDIAFLRLC